MLICVEDHLNEFLASIERMRDEDIIQTMINFKKVMNSQFIVRGACGYETLQRQAKKLPGGSGKRDDAGVGLEAHLEKIAKQVGIRPQTLRTDVQIYRTFFLSEDRTPLALETCLPRRFYVAALSAPDPNAALGVAIDERSAGSYSFEKFNAYIQSLRHPQEPAPRSESERFYTVYARLSREGQYALDQLLKSTGQKKDTLINKALIVLYQTYSPPKPPSRKSPFEQLSLVANS